MPEMIPADEAVDVVIAKSVDSFAERKRPFVAIMPDQDTWNDFGRNFFAILHIRPLAGDDVSLHMRMMFLDQERSASVFANLLEAFGEVFPIEKAEIPFVSLLTDVDDYRTFIDVLGFEIGVSALRKMHDAVVLRTEGGDQQLLEMIDSEDFHFGVLRIAGAYDALRRGGRFFRRKLPLPLNDAAENFVFGARLQSADNFYTLRFMFGQRGIFRDRISVLIGRNGVGKTQLLKAIVDSLQTNNPKRYAKPRFAPAFHPSRVLVFSSVPSDPFPRSIGAWHGIDYEYFPVNSPAENGVDPLLASLVACKKSGARTLLGENRDKSRMDVIESALDPIGLWSRLYLPLRPRGTAEELSSVVEFDGLRFFRLRTPLSEGNTIRLVQQVDWSRSAVILDENLNPRHLSSGEYAMLRFIAQASAAIEQGSLLLLDEPETHLHPNYVSDTMEILDSLLQSTGSIAIIATHSAYVVRETPRERVNVLSLNGRQVSIDTPRIQTFGATIDSISQFVFGDTSISHRYQKTLAEWADNVGKELGIEAVIERYGEELNSESLSFIARRFAERPTQTEEPEAH